MDPITAGVISGLAVNALTGAAGPVMRRTARNRGLRVQVEQQMLLQGSDEYIISALAQLKGKVGERELDRIGEFLRSVEAQTFVRSVAIAEISQELSRQEAAFQVELTALLVLIARLNASSADLAAEVLLDLVVKSIRRAGAELRRLDPDEYARVSDRAIREKKYGYFRKSSYRAQVLGQRTPDELADILEFARRYRGLVHRRTGEIVPAYLDTQRRVPIDDIYVSPRFQVDGSPDKRHVGIQGLIRGIYRTVVLGAPGAGKSTLARKLAHDFSANPTDCEVVPFLVPLRSYEDLKREKHYSIVDFLTAYLNEEFQLRVPPGAIEYLLVSGRGFAIFDGLDELLDTARRREMTAAIENFADLYSAASILVTSRSVGYREAPLSPGTFTSLTLENFTDADVESYVRRWFGLDPQLQQRERERVATAFLHESLSVTDLRSNALMLGLLCNVYRGAHTIPQNRAELYEQCAAMLFERWDAGRGIAAPKPLKSDARAALQDVAFWVYTELSIASAIPEEWLRRRLTKFWQRKLQRRALAEEATKELLEMWSGRAWILTDVGTTQHGRRLYQFTHQTFLEYFAAVELVRRNPSPRRLWTTLAPYVSRGAAEVVAQVAIQTLDRGYLGAADAMLRFLLSSAAHDEDLYSRTNLLSFATRNMQALYATPLRCKELTRAAIDLFQNGMTCISPIPSCEEWEVEGGTPRAVIELDHGEESFFGEDLYLREADMMAPLLQLLTADGLLGRICREELATHCQTLMAGPNEKIAANVFILVASADLLTIMAGTFSYLQLEPLLPDRDRLWPWRTDRQAAAYLERWTAYNFWVPIVAWRVGLLGAEELVDLSGWDALVCSRPPFLMNNVSATVPSFLEAVLSDYLQVEVAEPDGAPSSGAEAALRKVARYDATGQFVVDTDWLDRTRLYGAIVRRYFRGASRDGSLDLADYDLADVDARRVSFADCEVVYGAFLLLAVVIEFERWDLSDYSRDQIARLKLGPLQPLEPVFVARRTPDAEFLLSEWLDRTNLPPAYRDAMVDWASHRRDLCA